MGRLITSSPSRRPTSPGTRGQRRSEPASPSISDIGFVNSFPIGNELETLGAQSANVSLELNKAADTLAVIYKHLGPGSAVEAKNDTLTIGGDGLAANDFTELTTVKLEDGKEYYVRIDARDAAGNWVQAGPDTFTFDEDHELEPAASFEVKAVDLEDLEGFKDDNKDDADDDGEVLSPRGTLCISPSRL